MAQHPDYDRVSSKERGGKTYWRLMDGKRPYLPGEPHTKAFDEAYRKLTGREPRKPGNLVTLPVIPQQAKPIDGEARTLDATWRLLRESTQWQRLGLGSQRIYAPLIEKMLDLRNSENQRYGECPWPAFGRQHAIRILQTFNDRPDYQQTALTCLKKLVRRAKIAEWIETHADPLIGLEEEFERPADNGGYETWEPEHCAKFERHFPIGSKERVAYAVARWLGDRVSDCARLDYSMRKVKEFPQEDGTFREVEGFEFQQWKGRRFKKGVTYFLPLTSMLRRELPNPMPLSGPVLVNEWGKRWQDGSLSNAMRKWALQAGLPKGYSMHGLRKALLTMLAESDATDRQMMAVSGHMRPEQLATYIAKANQKKMAVQAMDKLEALDKVRRRPRLRVVG